MNPVTHFAVERKQNQNGFSGSIAVGPGNRPRMTTGIGVHDFHQQPHAFRIDIRRDAVAEVEDMAGVRAEVLEHAARFARDRIWLR